MLYQPFALLISRLLVQSNTLACGSSCREESLLAVASALGYPHFVAERPARYIGVWSTCKEEDLLAVALALFLPQIACVQSCTSSVTLLSVVVSLASA